MESRLRTVVFAFAIGLLLLSVSPGLWRALDDAPLLPAPAPWRDLLASAGNGPPLTAGQDQPGTEEGSLTR